MPNVPLLKFVLIVILYLLFKWRHCRVAHKNKLKNFDYIRVVIGLSRERVDDRADVDLTCCKEPAKGVV